MLGHPDFHEMKDVIRRKRTSRSHHPLMSVEGLIPKWKLSAQNYPQIATAPAGDESTSSMGAALLLRQWYLSTAPQNKSFCRGLHLQLVTQLQSVTWHLHMQRCFSFYQFNIQMFVFVLPTYQQKYFSAC